jgi:5-methyltetrahydropteroyltriglutamate--homocysteine methyltransferase
MQSSQDRILTTHCGSLPRPAHLSDLLLKQEAGEPFDENALESEIANAVGDVLAQQLSAGVDVVSDGEQPRVGYATYVPMRVRGFGGASKRPSPRDHDDFPRFAQMRKERFQRMTRTANAPEAIADISYEDLSAAKTECELFKAALAAKGRDASTAFMTSASPGAIASTMLNAHYDTHENYVRALASEMRKEYELIASYGFVLQMDSPDLGVERARLFKENTTSEFLEAMEIHIDAMNGALAGIPRAQIRLHCCWGNWEGPHTHDIPLRELLPVLYQANVGALSIEFANPRHQHEYRAIKENPPPRDTILIPGVIDSTTNFVEHPEVVANRICEAADAMGGMSRVIAGTDCGFGTGAGAQYVAEDVVWAKLAACREGAEIATRRLRS